MKNIVIIGNGISGITAARHIRKQSSDSITVISNETDHFYSRTALMYIYMGHMKYKHTKPYEDWFWQQNDIKLVRDTVLKIRIESKSLILESQGAMSYDVLIIALGSKSNKFGWPGQDLTGVQGLYNMQDLENMEMYTKGITSAAIVGGGLIGIEMAEMLRSRNIEVTFMVRESSFWNVVLPPEESEMINRHIREHHVDLRLKTELKEIRSDDSGRATSVVTNDGEEIPCQFVGLTTGVSPNIGFLANSGIELDRGVLVNHYFETNMPDVYAVGDCAQFQEPLPGRKPIEQVWYTGRMHGETVAKNILGRRTAYNPGVWFNSAKFFDIEYQVYGDVGNRVRENEEHLYWEHPNGKRSIRLVYHKENLKFIGINLMGIRYRHEVCNEWIEKGFTISKVLFDLKRAIFDPEFYDTHEDEIIAIYNIKNPPEKVNISGRKGLLKAILP